LIWMRVCIGPGSMICSPPHARWLPKIQTLHFESRWGFLLRMCGAEVPALALPFVRDFWVGHRCRSCLVVPGHTVIRKTLRSLTAIAGLDGLIAWSCGSAGLHCPHSRDGHVEYLLVTRIHRLPPLCAPRSLVYSCPNRQ